MGKRGRMSDEAVKRATGKEWREWFAILDKAGAKKMQHRDIAQWVFDNHLGKKATERERGSTEANRPNVGTTNVATSGGWWSQMVTVEYERARGIRKVNENATGFLVAVHKTVELSLPRLEKEWEKILTSKVVAKRKLQRIPSKTKRRMLRYRADVGGVVVSLDERGGEKSRIMVEAIKLPNTSAVERERAFWKEALRSL